jgi:hypothetical protein
LALARTTAPPRSCTARTRPRGTLQRTACALIPLPVLLLKAPDVAGIANEALLPSMDRVAGLSGDIAHEADDLEPADVQDPALGAKYKRGAQFLCNLRAYDPALCEALVATLQPLAPPALSPSSGRPPPGRPPSGRPPTGRPPTGRPPPRPRPRRGTQRYAMPRSALCLARAIYPVTPTPSKGREG